MNLIDFAEIDEINSRLDPLTDQCFSSVRSIEGAITDILDPYDIIFPGGLDTEDDNVFRLESSASAELYLYVVVDTELAGFTVYAQILELEDILEIQDGSDMFPENDFLRQTRHSADD